MTRIEVHAQHNDDARLDRFLESVRKLTILGIIAAREAGAPEAVFYAFDQISELLAQEDARSCEEGNCLDLTAATAVPAPLLDAQLLNRASADHWNQ